MFGKIKLDQADVVFSKYIRVRDGKCVRCGSVVKFNNDGHPVTHQASHYFGRRAESTRFDLENVDCLCGGCHQYWGGDNHEDYRAYKIKQLGEKGYNALMIRHNTYKKKDRKLEAIIWKAAYEDLLTKR